jgi:hypothetical protein
MWGQDTPSLLLQGARKSKASARLQIMLLPTRFAPAAATAATAAARTATAATAAVAAESAAATAAMTGALSPGTGFVDVDCTTIQVRAIESRNCAVGFGRIRHLDECEAAGLTCVAVPDYIDAIHRPVLFK